jgi:shikimate kinase
LERPYRDCDLIIEETAGCSIAEIFQTEGEAGFRDRETLVLRQTLEGERAVIATGGGIILREVNRRLLRNFSFVVWLTAPIPLLVQRIERDTDNHSRRPALTSLPGPQEIEELMNIRQPWYQETAHFSISTEDRSPVDLSADILTAWNSYLNSR